MVGRWHFLLKWSLFRWHSFIFGGHFPQFLETHRASGEQRFGSHPNKWWCFLMFFWTSVMGLLDMLSMKYELYIYDIYIYITYDIGNPHIQIDGWNMMEGLCWCPSFFRNARMHSFRAQGGKNLDAGTLAAQCQREAWGSIYWTTSQK